jgi:NAD+ synthase
MKKVNKLFSSNHEAEAKRITKFIRKHFKSSPRKKVVLGLSGGLDSAVCAALYCRAIGPENVHVVLMPALNSSKNSEIHARKQAKILGIPKKNIHLRPLEKSLKAFGLPRAELKKGSLRIGNIAARLRMVNLFDVADKVGAIVSGTENLTEYLLGYFTIGGDAVSVIEPIHHLYKWEVRGLAKELGVISEILNKKPSAELWDGQTDEGELGFSYNEADIALASKTAEKNPSDYGVSKSAAEKVFARKNYTEFKRNLPFHLKRRG